MSLINAHVQQPYFWDRVASIDGSNIKWMDFNVSKENITKSIDEGMRASINFFEKRNSMLQQYGPLPRNIFIPSKCRDEVNILNQDILLTHIYRDAEQSADWNKVPR